MTQHAGPLPVPEHSGPSPGSWPAIEAQGTHTGVSGHEHAPQVQSEPQVCVPYVLHVRCAPGVQPVAPVHAPCATH